MKEYKERPKIGIGVMILRGNEMLMGKRKNSHGAGSWSFSGGHLEYGESFEECVRREVKEECGVEIKKLVFQSVSNTKSYDKHYVTVGFVVQWKSGEPRLLEPEKFEKWQWFPLSRPPKAIFEDSRRIIKSYKTGKVCFDS